MGKGDYNGGSTVLHTYNVHSRLGEKPRRHQYGALPEMSKEEYAEACRACSDHTGSVSATTFLKPYVLMALKAAPRNELLKWKAQIGGSGILPKALDAHILSFVSRRTGWRTLEESKRKMIRALALSLIPSFSPKSSPQSAPKASKVGRASKPGRKPAKQAT